jgi:MarR family transcriptional regulator, transcriptional regulator for hemolysin
MRKYDYQNNIGYAIKNAAKAFDTAFDQLLRTKVGINATQSRVIGTLAMVKDGMTQKEIADRIGIEAPTIVPILDKLEEQKFVVRRPDNNDRRNNLIFLTSKSEVKWDSIIDCAVELQKSSCKGISEQELETTKSTLRKITGNIASFTCIAPTDSIKKTRHEGSRRVNEQQTLQKMRN